MDCRTPTTEMPYGHAVMRISDCASLLLVVEHLPFKIESRIDWQDSNQKWTAVGLYGVDGSRVYGMPSILCFM